MVWSFFALGLVMQGGALPADSTYATPALAGAAWAVLAAEQGWPVLLVAVPGIAICFGWRVTALLRDWRAPMPSGPASV